jgi:hypothetical protein
MSLNEKNKAGNQTKVYHPYASPLLPEVKFPKNDVLSRVDKNESRFEVKIGEEELKKKMLSCP